jgi:hypothetical protein
MMAKRREDRPQTCREIVKEVLRLRDALVGVSRTAAITTGPAAPSPADAVATQKMPALRRRRWLPWAVAGSVLLALGGGLFAGRLYYDRPAPAEAAPEPAAVTPRPTPDPNKEREETLLREWKLYANPETDKDAWLGLSIATKLGLHYLKDRRLADAERFFGELNHPDQRKMMYRQLGKLGQAVVLARQDRPAESNKAFREVLFRNKNVWRPVWALNDPPLREAITEALQRNHVNAPETFPPYLAPLRSPPTPTPKAPPKGGTAG